MPFLGTCYGGPADGQQVNLRRQDWIAVARPLGLFWIYRWADTYNAENDPAEPDYFVYDNTLTQDEIDDGADPNSFDGSRPYTLAVQAYYKLIGWDVVSIDVPEVLPVPAPPPFPPVPPDPEPEPEPEEPEPGEEGGTP